MHNKFGFHLLPGRRNHVGQELNRIFLLVVPQGANHSDVWSEHHGFKESGVEANKPRPLAHKGDQGSEHYVKINT